MAECAEPILREIPVKAKDNERINSPAQNDMFNKDSSKYLDTKK